jgi:hypothetical protein
VSKEDKSTAKSLGESEIAKRLTALRVRPCAELAALPNYETDRLKSGKYEVYVTTYRDKLSDGDVQIVVQSGFNTRFGFGWRHANGFVVSKDDSISDMQEKDLYEFI